MRVLIYNWVDYLDDENRGGGVSVYLRNIMSAFGAQGVTDATFLSSGISYDLGRRAPRWERIRHGPRQRRDRRFEIVNSAVLSPAHHAFGDEAQISDQATTEAFFDFLEKTGPYDVVHFHNLEGIPAGVLALKQRFPATRVVLSLHNYYPFCPQVNLWHRESVTCTDFADGAACVSCLPYHHDARLVRQANAAAYQLKSRGIRPGTFAFDFLFRQTMRFGGRAARGVSWLRRRLAGKAPVQAKAAQRASAFAARRKEMVDQINAGCDLVLCVSDRTRALAAQYGLAPDLLRTSYIGTAQAAKFDETRPKPLPAEKQALTLAYLGYMRRDKGYFFLMQALLTLPPDVARRLHLVVAARPGAPEAMVMLEMVRAHLGQVTHLDGYTHDDLDDLLAEVDVGVIPVLWEDNLPQVAIEMHARHIPLLTADRGGAQELAGYADMVFPAGDAAAFQARLVALLAGEVDMDRYWQAARAPQSVEAHVAELIRLYSGEISAQVAL